MKLKEFLEQSNIELVAEAAKCKTIEEIEVFAKANEVELTKEDLEEMSERFKEKNVLLSDDELDKATGGATNGNNRSWYGTPACPGPRNCSFLECRGDCVDFAVGSMRTTEFGETTAYCKRA